MNANTNLRAVQQIYDAFHQGDIDSILRALADDVEWHQPGPTDVLPWAGTRHGRAQVAQFFTAAGETLDLLQFEPREFLVQGDTVVVFVGEGGLGYSPRAGLAPEKREDGGLGGITSRAPSRAGGGRL